MKTQLACRSKFGILYMNWNQLTSYEVRILGLEQIKATMIDGTKHFLTSIFYPNFRLLTINLYAEYLLCSTIWFRKKKQIFTFIAIKQDIRDLKVAKEEQDIGFYAGFVGEQRLLSSIIVLLSHLTIVLLSVLFTFSVASCI
jgi:hypothetical protein